ncbi:MAG: HD domain-containing protein [Lachnospiraceae bacterium]|nr:HD domain-containing protein [Lachnospiraceae bacterium]
MRIDKVKAGAAFDEYVSHYNSKEEKVRLKIEHTYRVSVLCEEIAGSLELPNEDVDLAWLIGLLHDVGRFEQLKNYGTFIDAKSIDHAHYGADILFCQGRIRDYIEDEEEDKLIETAVRFHSAYRIPDGLDERTELFCNIIRDADKIDILKVNVEFPLEEIYNVSTKELREGQVTAEVMDSFDKEHAVLRSLKKTAVDNVVGHISLVYELVFPISLGIVKEQGFLDKLMNFESDNAETGKQFVHIREKMKEYMQKHTDC